MHNSSMPSIVTSLFSNCSQAADYRDREFTWFSSICKRNFERVLSTRPLLSQSNIFICPLSTSSFQSNLTQYSQSNLSRIANLGTDQFLLLKYGPTAADTDDINNPLTPSQLPLQHDITRTDPFTSQFLGLFAYSRRASVTFVVSVSDRPSARSPARIRSAPTGRILVKCDICDFYGKLSRRAKLG